MKTSRLALFLMILWSGCSENEPAEPISVTFGPITAQATLSEVSLSGTMTINRGTATSAGFLLGTTAGLTMTNGEKLNAPGGTSLLTFTKNNLLPAKQYFVRAFAIAEGQEFLGDEISFSTIAPTYTTVAPLTAGRGQRVTITGNFQTSQVADVTLLVGNSQPIILSYSSTSLTFLVPEDIAIGSEATIQLSVAGHNLGVSEKIAVSKWSVLATIPSPNSFQGPLTTDLGFNYFDGTKAYHFTANRAYLYDRLTDAWIQNDALYPSAAGIINNPVFFKIAQTCYAGFTTTSQLLAFDLPTQAWTNAGTFPGAKRSFYYGVHAAAGNQAYFGLGYQEIDSGPGSELTEFWEFDGTTKTWIQRANYPGTPVGYGVAFAVGEYVLVGGGRNVANDAWVNDFYAYHRTNHNWTQVADYPGPFGTFMKAFALGNRGFVISDDQIWVYEVATNTWSLYPDRIPGGTRHNPQIFVGTDHFYIGAGVGSTYKSDFYKLYPF